MVELLPIMMTSEVLSDCSIPGDLQSSVTATVSGSVRCTGSSPKDLDYFLCRPDPSPTLSIHEFNCSQAGVAPGACQRLDKL